MLLLSRPADKVGAKAFSVVREAMAKTGTVGLSRLVLYRHGHAVLLLARDRGMPAWTLRHGGGVCGGEEFFGDAGKAAPSATALTMMKELTGERLDTWPPDLVGDRLHAVIKGPQDVGGTRQVGKAGAAPPLQCLRHP